MNCSGENVAHRTVFMDNVVTGKVYHDLDTDEIMSADDNPIDLEKFIGKTVSIRYD